MINAGPAVSIINQGAADLVTTVDSDMMEKKGSPKRRKQTKIRAPQNEQKNG